MPPEHYEALRRDVRELHASLTRILAESPPTPAYAHALREQADEARDGFAWMHHCGTLNLGYWTSGAYCCGCRSDVEKAAHVQAHYRLVPVDGLNGEGQA